MNSTIIADQKYINDINAHIIGIENKTDKFYQKNKKRFEDIAYPCFMQAVLQIKSKKVKRTTNEFVIELNTMHINKTGVMTDVDKYVIALAHQTVNLFLYFTSPEAFIIPLCYDEETNKHYAKVLIDEK